jgi:predicted regulator of Ras-like GTPase activity (Roadblock/LC7/MglB family)
VEAALLTDHPSRVDAILARLTQETGVLGAALISRDGLCVRSAGRSELNRETFSAMSATVMGAAEIALRELDGGATRSIVASTDKVMVVVVGASREMLVVASANADVAIHALVGQVQQAAAEVAKVLAGG